MLMMGLLLKGDPDCSGCCASGVRQAGLHASGVLQSMFAIPLCNPELMSSTSPPTDHIFLTCKGITCATSPTGGSAPGAATEHTLCVKGRTAHTLGHN